MILRLRRPDLVLEPSLLAVVVCEPAVRVQARVELALSFGVGELAVRSRAVGPVAAEGHRVLERTAGVLTVGVELAILLALMCQSGCRGRVPANALPVLAGCAKGADVINIDSDSWRRRRGLVGEFAVLVGALKIVLADGVIGIRRLALSLGHLDILSISALSFFAAMGSAAIGLLVVSSVAAPVGSLDSVEKGLAVPLVSEVAATGTTRVHHLLRELLHHLLLLLEQGVKLHLSRHLLLA